MGEFYWSSGIEKNSPLFLKQHLSSFTIGFLFFFGVKYQFLSLKKFIKITAWELAWMSYSW
jgi:hypothetical protein